MLRSEFIFLYIALFCYTGVFAQKGSGQACPDISITGPAGIDERGDPHRFNIVFSEKLPENARIVWTVSSGEILEGQGTKTIAVYHVERGESVTATVTVEGLPKECAHTASASTSPDEGPPPRLVDEFSVSVTRLDKKRLAAAVADQIENPNNQLYIIEYFNKDTSEFAVREKVRRLSEFLTTELKLDSTMFEILTHRDERLSTRIYLIPPGAQYPSP